MHDPASLLRYVSVPCTGASIRIGVSSGNGIECLKPEDSLNNLEYRSWNSHIQEQNPGEYLFLFEGMGRVCYRHRVTVQDGVSRPVVTAT